MTLSCSEKTINLIKKNLINNHNSDFYCLNCHHSFITKKLESHKKVRANKDFCNINMPSEDNKILKLNQYKKSNKALFLIYADIECITGKIDVKIILKIHLQQK